MTIHEKLAREAIESAAIKNPDLNRSRVCWLVSLDSTYPKEVRDAAYNIGADIAETAQF